MTPKNNPATVNAPRDNSCRDSCITPMDCDEVKRLVELRTKSVLPDKGKAAISAISAIRPSDKDSKTTPGLTTCDSTPWGIPRPKTAKPPSRRYPNDALSEIIGGACEETQRVTKTPFAINACSALSTFGAALQAHINVQLKARLIVPVCVFFLTLGSSSERKTAIDKLICAVIRSFEDDVLKKTGPVIEKFETDRKAWQAREDGLSRAIRYATEKGRDSTALVRQLHELQATRPSQPRIPRMLFQNVTTQALIHHLAHVWPSVLINTAEAGAVFGSHAFSKENQLFTFSTYDSLWSDERIPFDRKTVASAYVRRARMCMSLMVQPDIFRSFLAENEAMKQIGLMSRFLFSDPQSTRGYRTETSEECNRDSLDLPALDIFSDRVRKLLEIEPTFRDGVLEPKTVGLSDAAKKVRREYFNSIEIQLREGRRYEAVHDIAGKSADNAARLAAILQASKGFPILEVDEDSMKCGATLARWYLDEALRFLAPETTGERHLSQSAETLEKWLIEEIRTTGKNAVPLVLLEHEGPNALRRKDDLLRVINFLVQRERARLFESDGKECVAMNPALLPEASQ